MVACTLTITDMAKKHTQPPQPTPAENQSGSEPTTEPGRIASDVMEMIRQLCFHGKDARGKRPKLTEMIDSLIRPAATQAFADLQRRLRESRRE